MKKKKILFLTGTRADFGKLKGLIRITADSDSFEAHIFATGMHMLERYGTTVHEILKEGFENIYMYNNSAFAESMDVCLANTIYGFKNYVKELEPDMIVVHGDRPEALAGAIVGAFNNIRVAHIEGGELSGTVDGFVRHAVSKLSHAHFVSNGEAEKRLLQMGEGKESIFKIGSPEIDLMLSETLPALPVVRERYDIPYDEYAVLIYHPVTTDMDQLPHRIAAVADAVIESGCNYVVICPNNDSGSDIIFKEYERLKKRENFRVFTSIRFEYYLTLLKHAKFIIGNSSSAVREAPVYGVPAINIGSRQTNRNRFQSIFDVPNDKARILERVKDIRERNLRFKPYSKFGDGKAVERFLAVMQGQAVWELPVQKCFNDCVFPFPTN